MCRRDVGIRCAAAVLAKQLNNHFHKLSLKNISTKQSSKYYSIRPLEQAYMRQVFSLQQSMKNKKQTETKRVQILFNIYMPTKPLQIDARKF